MWGGGQVEMRVARCAWLIECGGCIGAVLWAIGCEYAVWSGVRHGICGGVLATFF